VLTYVNPAFCRYHGREASELIGRPFPAFASDQDLAAVRRAVSDLGPGRGMIALVHRIVLPDGGVRWQEWAHQAVMDASGAVLEYQAVGRDGMEIREAVEAHRRAEEKYRAIFENAPLGIFRNHDRRRSRSSTRSWPPCSVFKPRGGHPRGHGHRQQFY
jgi:PAS domain S-box-containing protein